MGLGFKDALIIRLKQNGDTLWTKSVGTPSIDGALDVIETFDGEIMVLGYTYGYWGSDADVWVMKINSADGELIWERIYGAEGHEFGQAIMENEDSTYSIVGSTESFGAGMSDALMMKIDSIGNFIYGKTYGGGDRESFYDIERTSSGYSLVGFTRSFGAGWEDVFLVNTEPSGDTIFSRTYGYFASDFGKDHIIDDSDIIIAGQTLNFGAGSTDILLIKSDSLGNTSCIQGNLQLPRQNSYNLMIRWFQVLIAQDYGEKSTNVNGYDKNQSF